MPIAIKKLGQRGGPAGQDKTINIMPNQAKKRKNPAVKRKSKPGEVPTRSSYGAGLAPKRRKAPIKKMKRGGAMKKKGYAMGGAMKKKGMKKGGKLKMVTNDKGERVPFFAADGVGKSAKGGMMKKKGYAMGGAMKKKGMKKGGMMKKKGYAKGGSVKVKSGDTLSQIAKSRGMTVKALLDANPGIKNANMIRVGQSIKIPGAAAGAGAKSKNPFKGMTKTQMAMLGSKDKGKQRAATRGARAQTRTTPSNTASVKASKDGSASAMAKARARRAAAKKAPRPDAVPKKTAPKPTRKPSMFDRFKAAIKPNRPGSAKMAGGGMMKKKGMKKGGAMKRSKGGTVRGAGAATRGKRFGRAG